MNDFTLDESMLKWNKKVKTIMNLCDANKKRIPKGSEGDVTGVSLDGKVVRVHFHGNLYKWFDKREYGLFLKEIQEEPLE